mgnify:CR=1 FL=1
MWPDLHLHAASALLHRTAEATMGHIVLTLFSRLPELLPKGKEEVEEKDGAGVAI